MQTFTHSAAQAILIIWSIAVVVLVLRLRNALTGCASKGTVGCGTGVP